MLNKIIGFSVRNKLIVGLCIIGLIGYGIYQATQLPIDAVPDITDNQVQVITVAPSFGATDIERLITYPIEQACCNISGLKQSRSFSRFGLSLVTLVFEDDMDVYWARQQVNERLQQVQSQIPTGIGTPFLAPVTTGLGEIYQYVIKPKKGFANRYDATQLRELQDWVVRRQLLSVKGVADVSSFGGRLKHYEIAVRPNRLNALGVTIADVFDAVANNNQNTGGSYIEKGPTVLYVRSEGLIGSIHDIENISITPKNRPTPLFLKDIAEVRLGASTRFGAMCYNDQGEVAGAVVMMLKGANSSAVINAVKERIAQIQKTLPEGVEIEPFLDRTKMVDNAIGTVRHNLLEGALIVVLVLVLFLGNVRAGLLVASVIPLAMLFAIIMMNVFGVSGNLMSLGALDFGLIVDGAVIIVEAVMHRLGQYHRAAMLDGHQMDMEVTQAASKMMNSAVFGQIIILVVYLPIFTLKGIEGKMFKPMAQTVAFALLGAFILSLTYIPMMSAFFLSRKTSHAPTFSDRLMFVVETAYKRSLAKVLRFPALVLGGVGLLFGVAMIVLASLGGEFIPALEEGDFAMDTKVLTGSNLNTTIQCTQQAAHLLKTRFPEVTKVVTKIGSGEIPTDPMPMDASDMMIILKDKSEWTSAKTFPELSSKMAKALEDIPGITVSFQFPVQMRFNELMTGARQDVVCKIFGDNLDSLSSSAQHLASIVGKVKGAENIYVEPVTGAPQVVISYKRAMVAQYHISIADINKTVNTAFAGQSTGLVFEEEKRFDLVVRLAEDERKSIEDVQNLLIPTPMGIAVPLYQLADVRTMIGPNQIQREGAKRRIIVGFNVRGRDVESIVNELKLKASAQLALPIGYYMSYGGAFENLNQAKQRLMIAVPVSLLLIFVLLYFAFKSVKQGLLIYTAIPLSAIGGVLLLAIRGIPFSISAGVGFIALFGVAVLNGIVLVAEFNQLRQKGVYKLASVVMSGTRQRLRPILMTAFVASLGFLPMAVSNGAGAEVQRPLATVVIGGLLVATFLTLYVLPLLYIVFEKGRGKHSKNTKLPTLLVVLTLVSLGGNAQRKLALDEAIRLAIKNNSQLKDERLQADYKKALINTATDIPKTNAVVEYGQINSAFNDSKFGIYQSMAFPTVYKRQKVLLTEQWKAGVLGVGLKELELKKSVASIFYSMLYLGEKQRLLRKADSLFDAFYQRALIRLSSGEANILEKTAAELQKNNIAIQLKQVEQATAIQQLELQWLLHSKDTLLPVAESLRMPLVLGNDSISMSQNPVLKVLLQQQNLAGAQTDVEKSKLMPDFSIGYLNNSFVGIGPDGKNYASGNRFHSFQIGMGIPIVNKAQKARVAAAVLMGDFAKRQYQTGLEKLQSTYKQLLVQYKSNLDMVVAFEQKGLPSSDAIIQAANGQLAKGQINYLEFVTLINQSIDIQSCYLDALNALNDNIIGINFLTPKQ